MVALLDGRQASAATIRLAAHVMPAAFAALAAGGLLHAAGAGDGTTDAVIAVVGAAVTTLVAVRTKHSNAALIAGLAAAGLVTAVGAVQPNPIQPRTDQRPIHNHPQSHPQPDPQPTHTRSTDMHITNLPPTSSTRSFPAYYLGRPVAVYQRRYRCRATANRQLT